jgi:hypothetical protein
MKNIKTQSAAAATQGRPSDRDARWDAWRSLGRDPAVSEGASVANETNGAAAFATASVRAAATLRA